MYWLIITSQTEHLVLSLHLENIFTVSFKKKAKSLIHERLRETINNFGIREQVGLSPR